MTSPHLYPGSGSPTQQPELVMRDGRHTVPLEIVYDEPLSSGPELRQEWLRDIGMSWDSDKNAYKEKSDMRRAAPKMTMWKTLEAQKSLLIVRFPDETALGPDVQSAERSHPTGTSSATGSSPELSAKKGSISVTLPTPTKSQGEGSSFYQASGDRSRTQTELHLERNMRGHFDPRFVVVKAVGGPANEAAYKELRRRGMEYLRSPPGEQKHKAFLNKTKITTDAELKRLTGRDDLKLANVTMEDTGSLRLCDLINSIASRIIGETYQKLMHWGGYKGSEHSDSNVFNANNGDKMDLFFLVLGRAVVLEYSMDELSVAGEGKNMPSDDSSPAKVLLQKARYQSRIISSHPICGTVVSFTWTGTRLRFWTVGPRGYSSSRLINLEIPSHYDLFVEWIVFCIGLPDRVLPRWEPSSQMKITRTSGEASGEGNGQLQSSSELSWRPKSSSTDGSVGNGLLDARLEPIGNRTAVWAGELVPDEALPIPIIVKACWLIQGLAEVEYKILDYLERPTTSEAFPQPPEPVYRKDWIEAIPDCEFIRSNIPKLYGKVKFTSDEERLLGPSVNASVPPTKARPEPFPVTLSIIVMKGRPAIVLSSISRLTTRQLIRIFIDVVKILQYVSCHGVHYRDLNLGNIMVVPTYTSSNELIYRGVLVDYGNAVYAGTRRLAATSIEAQAAACDDDGRSANAYFMSLNAHQCQQLSEAYQKRKNELAETKKHVMDISRVERAEKAASDKLRNHRLHRYIDDLESLIYCMSFEVGRRGVVDEKQNPAINLLYPVSKKQQDWEADLGELLGGVFGNIEKYQCWRVMVDEMVQRIKNAQRQLDVVKPAASAPILEQENSCFREVIDIMEKAYSAAPEDELIWPNGLDIPSEPDRALVTRTRSTSNASSGFGGTGKKVRR